MSEADRQKWNTRYAQDGAPEQASSLIRSLDAELPRQGRALDIGGGGGRHALWLAKRGLSVTVADISERANAIATLAAQKEGLALRVLNIDFDTQPFPEGPWDLLLSFHYLWRPIFSIAPQMLSPGGILVFVQPTLKNLERHSKPSAGFLMREGEARSLAQELEILRYDEGWLSEGRHEVRMIARKKASIIIS